MGREQLEAELMRLSEEIEKLREEKRRLTKRLDQAIIEEAVTAKLGGLTEAEKQALAQIVGAMPAEASGEGGEG